MNPKHPHLYLILFIGASLSSALLIAWQWSETAFAMDFMSLLANPISHEERREKPPAQTVKGLYLTAYSAGNPKKLDEIIRLLETTELNAVVVDIKDYSGYVLYDSAVPLVNSLHTKSVRVKNLRDLVATLHEHHIYAIARQTVFQDPILAERMPAWAIHSKAGGIWRDRNGLSWVDPTVQDVWVYNVAIAKEAIRLGFDEINFDYVRFPSDGNLSDVAYATGAVSKQEIMRQFYSFVSDELNGWPAWISLDMFGLVMERHDGMNIGQRLEDAVSNADYIDPMMYPSHYARGHLGFPNPADHPQEVFANGLKKGLPYFEGKRAKVRPWIQAFNLGAVYDAEKIRAQIDEVEKATDAGWLLWNAANRYSAAGLLQEEGTK